MCIPSRALGVFALLLIAVAMASPTSASLTDRQAFPEGQWSALPLQDGPNPRFAELFWDGTEMIVWKGITAGASPAGPPLYPDDAAAYNPQTHAWRAFPTHDNLGRKIDHLVVAGRTLLGLGMEPSRSGTILWFSRYDRGSYRWVALSTTRVDADCCLSPVWTGSEVYMLDDPKYAANGTRPGLEWIVYNPTSDTWRIVPIGPIPGLRSLAPSDFGFPLAFWTGDSILLWPQAARVASGVSQGVLYNPQTNAYRLLSTSGAPSVRDGPTVVWTGRDLIVWSGAGECPILCPLNDGAVYDLRADRWHPISGAHAPTSQLSPATVWTGEEMIVWGGGNEHGYFLDNGAAYNPETNTWRPLPLDGAPSARQAPAVWTGTEMLIWGGVTGIGETYLGDGAAYEPGQLSP